MAFRQHSISVPDIRSAIPLIRSALRLHFECACRHHQIAAACSLSPATVSDYLNRARQAGLTWQQAQVLSDAQVEARLFKLIERNEPSTRAAIDAQQRTPESDGQADAQKRREQQ